jgi:D-glycero-D-manno-heptose 1,7-bisphosphate phosphatase
MITEQQQKEIAERGYTIVPVLAMDLDGTVRRTKSGKSFIDSPDDIELMPGIEEAIDRYRQKGYLVVGISNQGGVAYGHKTAEDVGAELDATEKLFKQSPFVSMVTALQMEGGKVEPYNYRSLLRKPQIGMLALTEVELGKQGAIVDWNNSLMVGDRDDDLICAERAGVSFMWIEDFLKQDTNEQT